MGFSEIRAGSPLPCLTVHIAQDNGHQRLVWAFLQQVVACLAPMAATTVWTGSGQNPGAAILTCDRGRNFQIEFITGAGTATGFGFDNDNQGNVYRVLF